MVDVDVGTDDVDAPLDVRELLHVVAVVEQDTSTRSVPGVGPLDGPVTGIGVADGHRDHDQDKSHGHQVQTLVLDGLHVASSVVLVLPWTFGWSKLDSRS